MRVTFPCKACGRDISAVYTRPGKTAQCVGCHLTQEIPAPPGEGGPQAGNPAPPASRPEKGGGGGGGGGKGGSKFLLVIVIAAVLAALWFAKKKGLF